MLRSLLKRFQEIVHVERFSTSLGVLQKIDPRVKLYSFAAFILSAIAVRTITSLIVLLAVIITLSLASQIPLRFFLVRTTIFIPIFAGVIALPLPFITPGTPIFEVGFDGVVVGVTGNGIYRAALFTLRVWMCVASLILLVLTTRFSKLIQAMANLRFPEVLVTMTAVTYRFIFLFVDEAYRMILAKESRTVTGQKWRENVKTIANMVATLLIRAYERGERVYLAMMVRGYAGVRRSGERVRLTAGDWAFASISSLTCMAVLSAEYLRLGG